MYSVPVTSAVSTPPIIPYGQEQNWTSSIACLRSLCDLKVGETTLVERFGVQNCIQTADAIINSKMIPGNCEYYRSDEDDDLSVIHTMLSDGFGVMVHWGKYVERWSVVLGIVPRQEHDTWDFVLWDPAYMRAIIVTNKEVEDGFRSFIAIRRGT